MEDKRRRRRNWNPFDISTEQTVTCSRCEKTCLSRIGFISHQRPAPDEDFLLPESSFAKQSHEDDDDDDDDDDIRHRSLIISRVV